MDGAISVTWPKKLLAGRLDCAPVEGRGGELLTHVVGEEDERCRLDRGMGTTADREVTGGGLAHAWRRVRRVVWYGECFAD